MIVVVTNAGTRETVDNAVTAELVEEWQRWGQTEVVTFELASTLDLKHNYIDPNTPDQPVDVAQVGHPLLIELIHRE